jgi:hypothetical protein
MQRKRRREQNMKPENYCPICGKECPYDEFIDYGGHNKCAINQ